MHTKITKKNILRTLIVFCLIAVIAFFANPEQALARRGGGRIGGSSFRSPSFSSPSRALPRSQSRSYPRSSGNYGGGSYGGGLFFLPFLIGGGGGSMIGLLALVAIAGVVTQAVRNSGLDNFFNAKSSENNITLAKIQIGLLASARQLQHDLNRLAAEADTNTPAGLSFLLREATVSLMRHPEYWVYANSATENSKLELAEQKFNALAMNERVKLNAEVVSNFNNRRQNSGQVLGNQNSDANLNLEAPSEYIVVTVVVAMAGNSKLPQVRSADELKSALALIGAASDLFAVEILWEPQSETYTLTSDEVLSIYPSLIKI